MKARLKVLPDKLRGGAWPSSVRAARCPVKSGNERDLHRQLPASPIGTSGTLTGPLPIRQRREEATAGQYAPNFPGHTRPAMVGTEGSDPERGRQSLNPIVVGTEG